MIVPPIDHALPHRQLDVDDTQYHRMLRCIRGRLGAHTVSSIFSLRALAARQIPQMQKCTRCLAAFKTAIGRSYSARLISALQPMSPDRSEGGPRRVLKQVRWKADLRGDRHRSPGNPQTRTSERVLAAAHLSPRWLLKQVI